MITSRSSGFLVMVGLLWWALAGCAVDEGGGAVDEADPERVEPTTDLGEPVAGDLDEPPDEPPPEPIGGGRARLVVGDTVWDFDEALCVFGDDPADEETAEFVLSSIQDGLQLTATIDAFGHSISLEDIDDFDGSRVSWHARQDHGAPGDDGFIRLDGDRVVAAAVFENPLLPKPDRVPGTLTARCG
jgi:hypothetical protein